MTDKLITDLTGATDSQVTPAKYFEMEGALKATLAQLSRGLWNVSVYRTTNQSINNNTITAVSWDGEESDPHGLFAATTAYVTIPTGATECRGVFQVAWASNSTGDRRAIVEEETSGSVFVKFLAYDMRAASNESMLAIPFGWRPVTAANRIVATVRQLSGGALNLFGAALNSASGPSTRLDLEFR